MFNIGYISPSISSPDEADIILIGNGYPALLHCEIYSKVIEMFVLERSGILLVEHVKAENLVHTKDHLTTAFLGKSFEAYGWDIGTNSEISAISGKTKHLVESSKMLSVETFKLEGKKFRSVDETEKRSIDKELETIYKHQLFHHYALSLQTMTNPDFGTAVKLLEEKFIQRVTSLVHTLSWAKERLQGTIEKVVSIVPRALLDIRSKGNSGHGTGIPLQDTTRLSELDNFMNLNKVVVLYPKIDKKAIYDLTIKLKIASTRIVVDAMKLMLNLNPREEENHTKDMPGPTQPFHEK